jgi:hypothetical protein
LDVLNDPQVKETTIAFIKSVTGDVSVQQSTGDAMWNAVKHAVRPAWLSKHAHEPHPIILAQIASQPTDQMPTVEEVNPNEEGEPDTVGPVAPVVVGRDTLRLRPSTSTTHPRRTASSDLPPAETQVEAPAGAQPKQP